MDIIRRRLFDRSELVIAIAIILGALGIGVAVGQDRIVLFLVLLGGLGVTAVVYQRPAIGAALILALAPLEGTLMIRGHSFVKLVTVLCVLVLLVRNGFSHRGIKVDLTSLLILPFILWAFTTILWTPDQSNTISKWISFALQSTLYIILLNSIQSRDDLKLALWGHVLGGLVLAIILTNTQVTHNFLRKDSVAGLGVNLVARIVALNVLLSMLLFQLETRTLARAILLISIILSIIGTVVSLSRGAWFAVALSLAALAIVYLLHGRLNIKPANFLWLLVIGMVSYYALNTYLFSEHGVSKMVTRFEDGVTFKDNAGGRFDIWLVGWNMFSDAPLWGHGFESFSYNFVTYAEDSRLRGIFHQQDKAPHNSLIGIVAQLGLIGFYLFLAVLISVFRKVWLLWREKQASIPALAWVSALIVFLMVANSVDYAVDRKYLWYVLGIITLISAYWRDDQVREFLGIKQSEHIPSDRRGKDFSMATH